MHDQIPGNRIYLRRLITLKSMKMATFTANKMTEIQ